MQQQQETSAAINQDLWLYRHKTSVRGWCNWLDVDIEASIDNQPVGHLQWLKYTGQYCDEKSITISIYDVMLVVWNTEKKTQTPWQTLWFANTTSQSMS
jgi:hypothetical protein